MPQHNLRDLERSTIEFNSKLKAMQAEVANDNNRLKSLPREIEDVNTKIRELKKQKDLLTVQIRDIDREVGTLADKESLLRREREKVDRDLYAKEGELKRSAASASNLAREIEMMKRAA